MQLALHLPTIMVVHACSTLISTLMIVYMWFGRRDSALLSFLAMAAWVGWLATALQLMREVAPLWFSTGVGLGLAAASLGYFWQGLVAFDRGRPSHLHAWIGSFVWWGLNLFPSVHDSPVMRTVIIALLMGAYSLLCARQIWQGRLAEPLRSRAIASLVHLVRAGVWFSAVPLSILVAPPFGAPGEFARWFVLMVLANTLLVVLAIIAMLILAMERDERVHRLASERDPLTGLANRRYFVRQAEGWLASDATPVALLMLDIDHFKQINDGFGHAAGDRVLVAFARLVEEKLDPDWIFARTGGEEFAILIPDRKEEQVAAIAEMIRAEVAACDTAPLGLTRSFTVSIGFATTSQAEPALDPLMAAADAALYQAKAKGRNCVRQFEPARILESVAHSLSQDLPEARPVALRK